MCPTFFGKGSLKFSFFSLSAASEIIALAACALSHSFHELYTNLSNPIINTTSTSEIDALSSKKFQTAMINQW